MRTHAWNLVFIAFFVLIVFLGVDWLADRRQIFLIGPWDFVLITLATFRLVRLFCYDHITDFVRGLFAGAPEGSFRGTLGTLIGCPWCAGLWFASVTLFAYFATPYAYPFVLVLAIAAVASFLQLSANLVGWHAEGKKIEVKSRQ